MNVGSTLAAGSAEYKSEMGNSYIAAENARRARMSGANARLVAQTAEEAKRREIRKSLGRSAAAISQAGTGGPGVGSNAALLKQASAEGELDALNIRYDGQMEGYNYELEALNQDAAQRAARRRARGAKWATALGVASNVIGGASSYRQGSAAMKGASRGSTRSTPGVGPVIFKGP